MYAPLPNTRAETSCTHRRLTPERRLHVRTGVPNTRLEVAHAQEPSTIAQTAHVYVSTYAQAPNTVSGVTPLTLPSARLGDILVTFTRGRYLCCEG